LIRPAVALAVAINRAVRHDDEWFDEPDDLDRLGRALDAVADIDDVVTAAGVLMYRVARAQAFSEGNKRTALLLGRWLLDRNGQDGRRVIASDDHDLFDLLVAASAGQNVEDRVVEMLRARGAATGHES
jgi:prophage maintenance system killer protein